MRKDDFKARRTHLSDLSDEQIKARFWECAEQIVEPLLKQAHDYTTPSVERSVVMRMGFSSIEANALVKLCMDYQLMPKGAGHVIYKASQLKNIPIRTAGLELIEGMHWQDVISAFGGEQNV